MTHEILPNPVYIVVVGNATDSYMIKYNPNDVDYASLKDEVIRVMRMGLKMQHIIDLNTVEILEQEVDKIMGM